MMTSEQLAERDIARLTPDLQTQMAKLVLAGWRIRIRERVVSDDNLYGWIVDTPEMRSFYTETGVRFWHDLGALVICAWVYQHERKYADGREALLP